jgi:hypothetical protein
MLGNKKCEPGTVCTPRQGPKGNDKLCLPPQQTSSTGQIPPPPQPSNGPMYSGMSPSTPPQSYPKTPSQRFSSQQEFELPPPTPQQTGMQPQMQPQTGMQYQTGMQPQMQQQMQPQMQYQTQMQQQMQPQMQPHTREKSNWWGYSSCSGDCTKLERREKKSTFYK